MRIFFFFYTHNLKRRFFFNFSRFTRRFSGLKAASYHATNVALHGAATGLVLLVARTVACRTSALLTASLFAVHPVHADAVASVVGRADVLSCVFFMLSFLCYDRHVGGVGNAPPREPALGCRRRPKTAAPPQTPCCDRRRGAAHLAFCVLFALLSMLAKENGVSVMAVCIGYELMLRLRSVKKNEVGIRWFYSIQIGLVIQDNIVRTEIINSMRYPYRYRVDEKRRNNTLRGCRLTR